jgi:hypothetical protein
MYGHYTGDVLIIVPNRLILDPSLYKQNSSCMFLIYPAQKSTSLFSDRLSFKVWNFCITASIENSP